MMAVVIFDSNMRCAVDQGQIFFLFFSKYDDRDLFRGCVWLRLMAPQTATPSSRNTFAMKDGVSARETDPQ